MEVATALAETAGLGAFFEVTLGARSGEWLRLSAFRDTEVLRSRIAATRSALAAAGSVEPAAIGWRVAASTVSLGIFARLVAPPLGCLVTTGLLPRYDGKTLWWQPVPGGAVPLALDEVGGIEGATAADFDAVVLTGLLVPLVAALRRESVSTAVLVGNVSSALGGAAVMISAARPELAGAAWSWVGRLLALPMLAGTATVEPAGRSLRRRSCCLFYRVPGGGLCADCILADRGALSR